MSESSNQGNGGTIHIEGGDITARGGATSSNSNNNTIYGGAGIGGGDGGSGVKITITGKNTVVHAYGNCQIKIKNDDVSTSTIDGFGAGIGGGLNKYATTFNYSEGGTIEISGGAHVYAYGGTLGGAGIGSGPAKLDDKNNRGVGSKGGTVTISGAGTVVEAYGGDGGVYNKTSMQEIFSYGGGAGIGGGLMGDGGNVTISDGATVYARGGTDGGAGIGGGCRDAIDGTYCGGDGGEVRISGESTKVYAFGGTPNNNDITNADATENGSGAGIGGGRGGKGGPVTINGGTVKAYGGKRGGAGIGGGYDDNGNINPIAGTINIYGGRITAHGGEAEGTNGGAGIGGGSGSAGGTVRITCGEVKAIGGKGIQKTSDLPRRYFGGAGIGGGGLGGHGDTVVITGGTVEAIGAYGGAGIGGGSSSIGGYGGTIEISGADTVV